MKLIARGVAFALALLPALAYAEDKSTTQTTSQNAAGTAGNPMNTPDTERSKSSSASDQKMTDARLVALLHHVNQEEIAAGKLAEKKGHSEQIKAYGQQLVKDHTKADSDVKDAAKKAGISISESALTQHDKEMSKVDKNKMDQLKRMSGAEFDRTFAQVMSKDHDHMISMLRDHKGDLKSDDLKQLVDNTIPVLQEHKDMADRAMSEAKSGSNQGRSSSSMDRSASTPATPPRALPDNSTSNTKDHSTPSTGEKSTSSGSDKK